MGLMAGAGTSNGASVNQSLEIAEIRAFFVGGRAVTVRDSPIAKVDNAGGIPVTFDQNGEYQVDQLYVQMIRLRRPRAKFPLLMWHGGGLTGVQWETTPDGRPGWQMYFLRAGHDVCVSDGIERGRATTPPPGVWDSAPVYMSKQWQWRHARIGTYDEQSRIYAPHPGTKFPSEAMDDFMKQISPAWPGNAALHAERYADLVKAIGPCVIICFSQSGNFGTEAAQRHPDLVKGLILIEPSGAPDATKRPPQVVAKIPTLYVWGDNLTGPLWENVLSASRTWYEALQQLAAPVEWVSLPERGITGNTHMMMMDRNSDQIADIVQLWMRKHGLVA
jgi:pimeloyl-ACP methyl ester carboxylesterase